MSDLLNQAIQSTDRSVCAFCRYITGNDTGKTGSHQAGFYIPKEAARLLFDKPVQKGENKDKYVTIKWQNDFQTESRFIYYGKGTRNEFRITRFGWGFPLLDDDHVGDLLILAQQDEEDYDGFVLSADEDIDGFLAYYNLSPEDTNKLIDNNEKKVPEDKLSVLMDSFVSRFSDFPDTITMASGARDCYNEAFHISERDIAGKPDRILLQWVDAEYTLFQKMEEKIYTPLLHKSFSNVAEFTEAANQILNRRKSRAGKSLEHHLASVFDASHIVYEEQVITEDNKKPDFIFPDGKSYHDFEFPADLLISLAAKTTCKDRWRQVISEADRIPEKHLFTLQQAISKNQLKEMKDSHVHLVVPQKYIGNYPEEYQSEIWNLQTFINFVRTKQANTPKSFFFFDFRQ